MAQRKKAAQDNETAPRDGGRREDGNAEARAADNGGAATRPEEQPAAAPDATGEEAMRRAEEMVDRLAERMAHWTSVVGRQAIRLAARAREEAEDIWAEAQHIRRGGNP